MKLNGTLDGKNIEVKITDEQIKSIIAEQKPKRWEPTPGNFYWFVDCEMRVQCTMCKNDNTDYLLYEYGNCFKTQKEAKFEAEKRKVLAELEVFAKKNNEPNDWRDERPKYYIYYDYTEKILLYSANNFCRDIYKPYFSSEELVKKAIELYGDRLLKYVIGEKEHE